MAASHAAGFAPRADTRTGNLAPRGRVLRSCSAGRARTTIHVACHDAERTEIRVAVLPRPGAPRAVVRAPRRRARRSSAGSSCARTARRSARCAPTASCASTCRSTRRGTRCAPACTSRAAPRGSRAATALDAEPRGDLLQAGPLLVADGDVAYDPEADDEGFRAGGAPVRPRPDRGPPPARGARPRPTAGSSRSRATAARAATPGSRCVELARLMVALGCEHALNLDGGGSTALISGGRLQNLPRGDFEVPEPGGRADRHGARVPLPPLAHDSRPTARVWSRPGHDSFTAAAGRHGARVLPARRAPRTSRATSRRALGGAGWDVTVLSGSLTRPGEPGDAREFYAGLDVRPQDFTRALEAPDPMRADPPMHPSFEDRPGAPDRVFASLDDDEYERQVDGLVPRAAVGRRGERRRAAPAPPDADPRGGARGSRPACRSSATCTAPSC